MLNSDTFFRHYYRGVRLERRVLPTSPRVGSTGATLWGQTRCHGLGLCVCLLGHCLKTACELEAKRQTQPPSLLLRFPATHFSHSPAPMSGWVVSLSECSSPLILPTASVKADVFLRPNLILTPQTATPKSTHPLSLTSHDLIPTHHRYVAPLTLGEDSYLWHIYCPLQPHSGSACELWSASGVCGVCLVRVCTCMHVCVRV